MTEPVSEWPPVAGWYAMRLVKGGPRVTIRIWFGAALIDGEMQDRSHDWRVEVDGLGSRVDRHKCHVALDVRSVWPWCARFPISESEYHDMRRLADWAKRNDPWHPSATPRAKVDVSKTKPIF